MWGSQRTGRPLCDQRLTESRRPRRLAIAASCSPTSRVDTDTRHATERTQPSAAQNQRRIRHQPATDDGPTPLLPPCPTSRVSFTCPVRPTNRCDRSALLCDKACPRSRCPPTSPCHTPATCQGRPCVPGLRRHLKALLPVACRRHKAKLPARHNVPADFSAARVPDLPKLSRLRPTALAGCAAMHADIPLLYLPARCDKPPLWRPNRTTSLPWPIRSPRQFNASSAHLDATTRRFATPPDNPTFRHREPARAMGQPG